MPNHGRFMIYMFPAPCLSSCLYCICLLFVCLLSVYCLLSTVCMSVYYLSVCLSAVSLLYVSLLSVCCMLSVFHPSDICLFVCLPVCLAALCQCPCLSHYQNYTTYLEFDLFVNSFHIFHSYIRSCG